MPVVWSDRHRLHDPRAEIFVGVRTPGTELPERAERIRAALVERGADVVEAKRSPTTPLTSVHAPELIEHLAGVWADWDAAGLTEDPGQDRWCRTCSRIPTVLRPRRRTAPPPITARAGQFAYDTMTLDGPGTWEAARAALDAAVTAADLVSAGRPPRTRARGRPGTTRPAAPSAARAT